MLKSGKSIQRPRVVVFSFLDSRPDLTELVQKLVEQVGSHAKVVGTYLESEEFSPPKSAVDFAIVFGGDGSILSAGQQLAQHEIPVLGVNLGKLGFLANVQPDSLPKALKEITSGNFQIIDHIMLHCEATVGDEVVAEMEALNEVSILGGAPFRILEIDLYVDRQLAASYNGDGLIVSTPVGSTAHNLSAGGPIVRKDLPVVVISPISPHTLTLRPVVDSADREFELRVRVPRSCSVVVDGNVLCELTPKHRVRIKRSDRTFRMIEVSENNYYQTLRDKLGWGVSFAYSSPPQNKSKKKK
ncbi:MAG: NAD(+)/NADH kinase [Pirellulaceae bacterium]